MRSSAVFLLAMVVAIQGASVPRDHAPSQIVEPYRPRIRAVDSRDPRQGQSAPRPLRPANKAGGPSPGPGGPASKSPDGPPGGSGDKSTSGSCPSVWKDVMAELKTTFMTGAICNDKARAAIRATFHDCGTWDLTQGKTGGCDGSLFVGTTPDEELARAENKGVGMQRIAVLIKDMAKKYNQSVADMIVFAGST